jgi:hypothetical protein
VSYDDEEGQEKQMIMKKRMTDNNGTFITTLQHLLTFSLYHLLEVVFLIRMKLSVIDAYESFINITEALRSSFD